MRALDFLLSFRSSFLVALSLTVLPQTRALAQDSYQDGMGAVDVSNESAPATPPVLPPPTTNRSQRKPVVGRQAAEKYMGPKRKDDDPYAENHDLKPEFTHYLSLGIGSSVSDKAYEWGGHDEIKNVEKFNVNLSYRIGEWIHVADLSMRAEYTGYDIRGTSARKISLLPLITFPDISSRFPLYFGLGAGPGFFVSQYHGESFLAIDYTALIGLRFLNVFDSVGFFVEGGIKNHFLVFTDGQFNGFFLTLGAVFAF